MCKVVNDEKFTFVARKIYLCNKVNKTEKEET